VHVILTDKVGICYAPSFAIAKGVVNYVGYVGSNLLNGDFKQVNIH